MPHKDLLHLYETVSGKGGSVSGAYLHRLAVPTVREEDRRERAARG